MEVVCFFLVLLVVSNQFSAASVLQQSAVILITVKVQKRSVDYDTSPDFMFVVNCSFKATYAYKLQTSAVRTGGLDPLRHI